jgi:hypothetical protein
MDKKEIKKNVRKDIRNLRAGFFNRSGGYVKNIAQHYSIDILELESDFAAKFIYDDRCIQIKKGLSYKDRCFYLVFCIGIILNCDDVLLFDIYEDLSYNGISKESFEYGFEFASLFIKKLLGSYD